MCLLWFICMFSFSAFSFTLPHLLGHSCRSTRWRRRARSREGTWPPLRAPCAGLVGLVRRQPGGGRDDFVLLMLLVVMFLLLLLVVMAMAKIFSPLGLAMGRRPRTFVQTLLWKENDFCAFSFWSKSLVVIWIFDYTPLYTFAHLYMTRVKTTSNILQ